MSLKYIDTGDLYYQKNDVLMLDCAGSGAY